MSDLIAPAARLYGEEEELAALAKEDIGENDGYLSTYMQGGAYVLSKVRPCLRPRPLLVESRACLIIPVTNWRV